MVPATAGNGLADGDGLGEAVFSPGLGEGSATAGLGAGPAALKNIGPEYGGIPVYTGVTKFPDVGQYEFIVSGSRSDGQPVRGHAYVTVAVSGIGVAVGTHAPPVSQAVLGVPGVTLAMLDSGVPPDTWHDVTVAQGIAQHRPMVLFFGDPAFCPSKTCGPTSCDSRAIRSTRSSAHRRR